MAEMVQLTSAMRANLVSLQSTAETMSQTQNRLSTGKKVNSALDNPAAFFAAQGYTQRAGLMTGLKENIGEGIQMIKAADNGVKAVTTLIEGLRGQLSQARAALGEGSTSGTTLTSITSQYNAIIGQINSITQTDSQYKGVNFLKSGTSYNVNFNEQGTSTLTLSGFDGSAYGLSLSGGGADATATTGTLASTDIDTTADIANVETSLNNAITKLNQESAKLSNNLTMMTTRDEFLGNMINTLTDGANNLTAADQNEEGANMLMLQTRTSLATTALSLSSQAAQSVLRLF